MAESKGRSPWVYVGCGCGLLALLIVAAIGGLGFMGVKTLKNFEREMNDPVAREAKAARLLGSEGLPEDYSAEFSISIPLMMDIVMLQSEDRRFDYFRARRGGDDLDRLFDGQVEMDAALDRIGVRIRHGQEIHRDQLTAAGLEMIYVAERGDVRIGSGGEVRWSSDHDDASGGWDGESKIASLMLMRCSGDRKLRFGLWTARDPAPETPLDELDLGGTTADPEEIRAFVTELDLCRD